MVQAVKDNNAELKRPKLALYNLIVTLVIMYMLVTGMANSALLFMAGIAAALFVNYGFNFKIQKDRLTEALAEGMPAMQYDYRFRIFYGYFKWQRNDNGNRRIFGTDCSCKFLQSASSLCGGGRYPRSDFPWGRMLYYFGYCRYWQPWRAEYGISAVTMA